MDCPPTPQFCHDFLLRFKAYLKESPRNNIIVSGSHTSKDVVRMCYYAKKEVTSFNPNQDDTILYFSCMHFKFQMAQEGVDG